FAAVVWTEREEPQAALGSHLHQLAYPDSFRKHVEENKAELKEAYHHHAREILDLTLRGEYLYTANGTGGFEVFDVANIDQTIFSTRKRLSASTRRANYPARCTAIWPARIFTWLARTDYSWSA